MKEGVRNPSFVTEGRLVLARNYADELARRNPSYSASECADKAVRAVFGRWLLDHTASIRPEHLPLFFQLTNAVETRLGLHRRLRHRARPISPVLRAALPSVRALESDEFIGSSAIAM
jgi:hypothetical protein